MRAGLFAMAALAAAQAQTPMSVLRGVMLEREGTPGAGVISVRSEDNLVHLCDYDSRTTFERDSQRISAANLAPGDRLEVIADKKGDSGCQARSVSISPPERTTAPGRAPLRRTVSPTESFAPRGHLTLSGIVVRRDPTAMILRTKANGQLRVQLRDDTRYLEKGLAVDAEALLVNTRVFVRAGKSFDNEVEAYQVVWGEILQPR